MNAFKKSLVVTSMALTFPLASNVAQAYEVSANVTIASDYRFRGISQNDTEIAIQGGFDVAFDNGLYVGTWGSQVDFNDPDSSDAGLELDYYFGYGGDLTEEVSYDVGYIYYDYPGSDATAFPLTGNRDLDYLETGEFWYLYADYGFELPHGFSLGFHAGYNKFENKSTDSGKDGEEAFLTDGEDKYTDYSITLGKSWQGLDFALSWVDTTLDDEECFDTSWCDSTLLFSISKSM
jgi:hypothetical protein